MVQNEKENFLSSQSLLLFLLIPSTQKFKFLKQLEKTPFPNYQDEFWLNGKGINMVHATQLEKTSKLTLSAVLHERKQFLFHWISQVSQDTSLEYPHANIWCKYFFLVFKAARNLKSKVDTLELVQFLFFFSCSH